MSKKAVSMTKIVYWKIPQFSKEFFEGKKSGDFILSETFTTSTGDVSTRWYMSLYPNGLREEDKSNVSLFLFSQNAEEEDCVDFKVNCELGVAMNELSNDYVKAAGERSREQMKRHGFGLYDFLSHADLFDKKKGFVVNGEFTVFVDLKLEFEIETVKPQSEVPLSATMSADYKKMFGNEVLSDFQLETSDKKVLKAHKVVLAARSPVFYAMLSTDMEEKRKGSAIVPDLDSKVMKEFLRFIYYNEVENLDDVAPKLIYAAEKYQLDELKSMCLQTMLSSLELKNAVEFLKIAYEVSGANELFEECLDMIVSNYSKVRHCPPWKNLPETLKSHIIDKLCEQRNSMKI